MYLDHRIAVVMPVYNEEAHVARAVSLVPEFVDAIIVVDDGSTDTTWNVLAGISDSRLSRLRHSRNCGVGAAIKTGYRHCLRGNCDIIAIMDGDGQMDGNDLPRLVDRIAGGADFAKGSRFLDGSIARMPWARWIGNATLSELTKIACNFHGSLDSQCGYSAISRLALKRLELDHLYDRYGFHNEMLFLCSRAGLVIETVAVKTVYRNEVSHINPLFAIPTILCLITRGYLRRRLMRKGRGYADAPVPEPASGD